MKTIQVKLPGRSYDIDIGFNILQKRLTNVVLKQNTDLVVVVTNETLQNLYPDHVSSILEDSGVRVATCVLPDGEQYKNLETLSQIFDFLMEVSANRKTLLIAFGGGVIGDMAGFADATFVRGIPYIQIPTTLLAYVDSSVGGKTAVNHPLGKNTIGAFKQPEYVCIELSFLKTLSSRELNAGYIELLKHGIMHDERLFNFVQSQSLEPLDFEFLEEGVGSYVTYKINNSKCTLYDSMNVKWSLQDTAYSIQTFYGDGTSSGFPPRQVGIIYQYYGTISDSILSLPVGWNDIFNFKQK